MTDAVAATEPIDVLVIGGGPAGLAAAAAARAGGAGRVVVIEREDAAGGVPRHCDHTGFGVRDLHRVVSGPRYADRIVRRAVAAGVEVVTRTMVTGWAAPGAALLTGPDGMRTLHPRAVILATGARERPRAARLVPGDRPSGVFTTGELQQYVHIHHLPIGRRAVVVGAEHVSYSAVLTLRDAGARTVAMTTALARHQSLRLFAHVTALGLRVPLWTGTAVTAINGRRRVESVEVTDIGSGRARVVAVDTVVFTGDWIPDHELARSAGLTIDGATRGPATDQLGRTSTPSVWAAGNLVHPGETADVAARRGWRVGVAAAEELRAPRVTTRVPLVADHPLSSVVPSVIAPGAGGTARLIVRTATFLTDAVIVVEQGTRELGRYRLRRGVPNRSHRIPGDWATAVDPEGGAVHVRVR